MSLSRRHLWCNLWISIGRVEWLKFDSDSQHNAFDLLAVSCPCWCQYAFNAPLVQLISEKWGDIEIGKIKSVHLFGIFFVLINPGRNIDTWHYRFRFRKECNLRILPVFGFQNKWQGIYKKWSLEKKRQTMKKSCLLPSVEGWLLKLYDSVIWFSIFERSSGVRDINFW